MRVLVGVLELRVEPSPIPENPHLNYLDGSLSLYYLCSACLYCWVIGRKKEYQTRFYGTSFCYAVLIGRSEYRSWDFVYGLPLSSASLDRNRVVTGETDGLIRTLVYKTDSDSTCQVVRHGVCNR